MSRTDNNTVVMTPSVFHVVSALYCGGLEKVVTGLVNARNSGCSGSSAVLCLDELGELAKEINGGAVECLNADRSHFPWDFSAVRKLKAVISDRLSVNSPASAEQIADNKERVTSVSRSVIFHAHNMAAWQYAVLAAIGTGARVVYTQHGANVHNLGLKNRIRSIVLSWFTDRIVAVSEDTAEAMTRYQGVPRCRIKVVRNGIDAGKFVEMQPQTCPAVVSERRRIDADERRSKEGIGIPSGAFVVGSVGRLDCVKGYDRLINVFAGLVRRQVESRKLQVTGYEPFFLLLVGDGPERKELERQSVELGIAKQVIFPGYCKDVGTYLQAMDVFVLPSRSEGISISLLEACSSGLPVVVTDAGGNGEIVENGVTGIVVPSGDDSAFLAGIERLVADTVLRRKMAEAARKRVREEFSIEKTMMEYEKIYSEIM